VLVVSNIASAAKIVDLGFSVFGIRLAFDGGTLLFPLAYVIGDVLTEVYGFKTARRVIWTGFAALALSALVFFVLRVLPPEAGWEAGWEAGTGTSAYNAVLGGISSGGIVAASLIAYLAGEFSNAAILSKIKTLMKGRLFWVRAIGSSIVGEFLDSFIFVFAASLTGVFPWQIFWSLVLANCFLKMAIEVLVLPANYAAVGFLKRKEGIDTYDLA
jgi:uncharacterized integral membrane protein (TIGR00697 family)